MLEVAWRIQFSRVLSVCRNLADDGIDFSNITEIVYCERIVGVKESLIETYAGIYICLSFDSFSKLIDVSSENHLTQEEGSSNSSSLQFSSPYDLTPNLLSSAL
ncbi:hypothetical protein LOD99_7832 [Oopsacas minuta]|uniref:Uncharacterized protein n=1 Tax=Oopsacas minuta TaxID=111878 RepID=A0AAV7JPN5_9METZ|nr:hypothetical protein LOD99_7832 [Oopsacas minuta]